MAMSEQQLAELLKDAGTRLLSPPSSVDDLLSLLDEIERCLERVDQSPSQTMQDALSPSLKALVAAELLGHSDSDVKVYVATCISEITRITAPDAPYSDDQMKEIFQLIVSSFENLHDISSRSYNKRITILETVAKVRSCVVMLDLECDDLILQMFQHFLKSVRDDHPEKVFPSMETIMTLVLEESEDISPELLWSILDYLKKDDKNVDPVARRLGESVLNKCSSKVKPYLVQAIQTLGISLDEYSNAVATVFQEVSGVNLASINSEVKETLKDTTSQAEVKETLKGTASQAEVSPAPPDTPKSTMTNGNLQKGVEEVEVVKEHLTEQKSDANIENTSAEESDTIKDEVELLVKPQSKGKSNKKRGRKGNLSKTTLAASEATHAVDDNDATHAVDDNDATHAVDDKDAIEVTDLQGSEIKGSVSVHSMDTLADKKRERKGNLSKTTLEPSVATPAEDNVAEELTDLQESESNDRGSLHSKDTPTDKKRGGKGNLSIATLESSEATPMEEDSDAEEVTDLQGTESKGSGSLHSKDTPINEKRERKGNLSKATLESSEATPMEDSDAEEVTDLQETESKGSGSLHSKDTPIDEKRERKGNLSKTTLEPSEAAPAEENNNAEELTDLQEIESKDSGSLHSKDTPADNTSPPNHDNSAEIPHSLSKASENKDVDIPSPCPSGDTPEGSHLKKNKTEAVVQEVITSPEDDFRRESKADVSESKEDKVTGQETSFATDKEEATLGPVDASGKDDGSTIDSDTKTTKLSGEKVESVQQDKKKIKGQGKTSLVKDHVKPPSKKECKEPDSSSKGATKSARKESAPASSKKGSDQKSSNKKPAAGKRKASEIEKHGKELVGSKIKVWWPDDKKFYEGVVKSFDPATKKHMVFYKDGDVENLIMQDEKWELIKGDEDSHKGNVSDGETPDASSKIHKNKKIKTNPEPSNKQGKTLSANEKRVGGNRSKVAAPKPGSKKSGGMNLEKKIDDEDAEVSGGSEDESDGMSSDINSGDESMDETPKGAAKSKADEVETPKTSAKSKQQAAKCYSRSKGKTVKGSGSKSNVNRSGKATVGSSSSKGKETQTGKKTQNESAKSSQSGKAKSSNTSSKNTSSKNQKAETKSGNKRKRGSSKK